MTTCLVLAAGRGERLAANAPKAAVLLGGRPLAAWSLEALGEAEALVDRVIVVGNEGALATSLAALSRRAADKIATVVPGGPTREESCARGLEAIEVGTEIVLVHDAARPFAPPALFAEVAQAARRTGAALAASPLTDTLKRAEGGRVVATLERDALWRAQTPQGFRVDVLRRAHALAERARVAGEPAGTDEAVLVERLGEAVEIVPGSDANWKITTAEDLAWAEAWIAARGSRTPGQSV